MRAKRDLARIGVLAAGILLAACSSPPSAPAPDADAVLQKISPADPAKYADLREKKNWQNPYLIVRAANVGLLSAVAANEEQLLKCEEVLNALARLPASAWPYGRVAGILVEEPVGLSEPEKAALRRNRGVVAGVLEGAHVEIVWMPSSKP